MADRKRRVIPKSQPTVSEPETKVQAPQQKVEIAVVKPATPIAQPTFASNPSIDSGDKEIKEIKEKKNEKEQKEQKEQKDQKYVYVLHMMTFYDEIRGNADPSIIDTSSQENLMYQEGCKRMLIDLKERFGEPKKIERDDDLDDPKVQLNQQLVRAFDCYRNDERYVDGENKGKLKLSWPERFRRIDAIYDKLRVPTVHQNQTGTYYYVTKTTFTTRK
jgi:hypothetical protein